MSDSEIIAILDKFSDVLEINSVWVLPFKWIGWALIRALANLVEIVSGVADKLFVLDTFYKNTEVIAFINSFKPLIWVLFALALVGVGYRVMFTKNKDFQNVAINIAIALSVIVALPLAMDKMMDVTREGVSFIKSDSLGEEENYANKIIKDNVTDILLYEQNGFSSVELSSPNNIPIKNIRGISATDSIDPDDITSDYKEVFEQKISIGADGTVELVEMNQGFSNVFKEYYARYKISYFYIIISLAVVAATQVFTSVKLGRLIFELAYNQLLALIVAPLDISSGQRLKKIIENIISIFFVTILIAALLKFYIIFVSVASDMGGIAGVILLISGSFAVIDGPNIVEKLFGIDAGIQSGFKMIAGTYATIKTAGAIGKGAGSIASKGATVAGATAVTGAGGAVAGVAGLGKGISNGIKQGSSQSENSNSKDDSGESSNNKSESGIYSDMEQEESKGSESDLRTEERPSSLYQDMDSNSVESQEKSEGKSTVNPPPISRSKEENLSKASVASNSNQDSITRPESRSDTPKASDISSGTLNLDNNIQRPSTSGEATEPITNDASLGARVSTASNPERPSTQQSIGNIDSSSTGLASGSKEDNRPNIQSQASPLKATQEASSTSNIDKPIESIQSRSGGLKTDLGGVSESSGSITDRPIAEKGESISSPISSARESSQVADNSKPTDTIRDTRTVEQALGDVMKSKVTSSKQYKNIAKAYNLSVNSGENIGKKIKGGK